MSLLQLCVFGILLAYINADDIPQPKIIIVGAGPAGLAAGTKLLEYGFKDFRILEAEPRFGGRIHTIPYADNVIDLGAQWCHGEENNVVYEMVHDMNLLSSSAELYDGIRQLRSNGEQIKEALQLALGGIMENITENAEKYDNENLNALEFWKIEFDKALEKPENNYIDKVIAEEFFRNFEINACCYEAADSVSELPARDDPDYENCAGDSVLNWKDKGYRQFLKILLKTAETHEDFGVLKDHLELSKKVKSINWQRDDLKTAIICEDGEEILADHVIVTVSLGVLKAQHAELFKPALPQRKQKAIETINFGTVNKIFIEFDKPFWPEDWHGFQLLWRLEDLKEIRGTDKAWLEGLNNFHGVNYQPRLLEGWMLGSFGRHMETLPMEFVKNETLRVIQRSIPFAMSNVLNFTITNWFSQPNFRGTYSYHSKSMLDSGIKPLDLEVPLTVTESKCQETNCEWPVVLFAGEATNTRHFSTVHGAVETGFREAKRLAVLYGLEHVGKI